MIRERFSSDNRPPFYQPPTTNQGTKTRKTKDAKKNTIRLTDDQVVTFLDEYAGLLVEQQQLSVKVASKRKMLDDEFTRHEMKYRKGVMTAHGLFTRKPHSFDTKVVPNIEE